MNLAQNLRQCKHEGCTTILADMNTSDFCYCHRFPVFEIAPYKPRDTRKYYIPRPKVPKAPRKKNHSQYHYEKIRGTCQNCERPDLILKRCRDIMACSYCRKQVKGLTGKAAELALAKARRDMWGRGKMSGRGFLIHG